MDDTIHSVFSNSWTNEDHRSLFESIMAVAVKLSVVIFSTLYFKTVDKDYSGIIFVK